MFNLERVGEKAKEMSVYAAGLSNGEKNKVLLACADALIENVGYILEENKKDMGALDEARPSYFRDRLLLNPQRIESMAMGLRKIAALDDPTGETLYIKKMDNGLQIGERRVPLGVVAIIYEARPNVTVDTFGLCFKSGNAGILRGGSEAFNSNAALVNVLQQVITANGHPQELVQLVTDTSRQVARDLMRLNKYVDVLIPRGGRDLIKTTIENSTVPTIETGVGNCHIFVDKTANLERSVDIVINAKVSRPGVCNSLEKLLVHADLADSFLPKVCKALDELGVEIRGDEVVQKVMPLSKSASESDWYEEYLDMIIGIKVVGDIDQAISHITKYSSGHSEAILTESYKNADRFINEVDSAAVYVNASTRFTDGEEFGLGAEIGISTQKLHVRGPMGLKALTTTKFVVFGGGQTR